MKIAFLYNKQRREESLCRALYHGMKRHGDELAICQYDDEPYEIECDAIAFAGMKCREWHEHCTRHGKRFLYFDKGYFYPKEKAYSQKMGFVNCWRVAVDTNQPLEYLAAARHSPNRWNKSGPQPNPWREPTDNGHIVLAGASPKYHKFHGLPHPTEYFKAIIAELRRYTDRPIHYRPKPSWWVRSPDEAVPIAGAEFVPTGSFEECAKGAHAIITHGSNAALIGMLKGVPSIIVGNGVMSLISSTDLREVEAPYLATDDERRQLLANLAWTQYTLREFRDGPAWHNIKTLMLQ